MSEAAVTVSPAACAAFVAAIFEAWGASQRAARIVADHLVESERMGLSSHGLIRVLQYTKEIENGQLDADVEPVVQKTGPATAIVDGCWTFGQVAGATAVDLVAESVEELGIGFAAVRRVQHTGRLAAYTQPLAERGFVAIATGSGASRFHRMAPFGGREGRTSTNPISWAVPTTDAPIVADMATSTIPEGRIRVMKTLGRSLPPDAIIDADGRESDDPDAFYGDADGGRRGALLPLGGMRYGHKGYSLALLAEALATLLAGDEIDGDERGNNLALLAIRGDADLPGRASHMAAYLKSAEPIDAAAPVLVPGELERAAYVRSERSLEVPEAVWRQVAELAATRDVVAPAA